MSLPPFPLVDWFAAAEGQFDLSLSHTDCEPLSVRDILTVEDLERFAEESLGYQPFAGMAQLRETIARQYETVTANDIVVCNGASEPIYTFMRSMLSAGDEVIVQAPLFHTLHTIARAIGCHVTEWRPADPERFTFEVETLRGLCRRQTRLIVINFPHNPSGQLISSDQLHEIAAIAGSVNAVLFSDEAFRLLELPPHDTLPAACDVYENAVTTAALSKPYGLGGLRLGWLASRNPEIVENVKRYRFYTTENTNLPSQFLAERALAKADRILEVNRQRIAGNLARLADFVKRHEARLSLQPPKGGTMAVVRQRTGLTSTEFCKQLLEDQKLFLVPGPMVGLPNDALRVGLGRDSFSEALERCEDFLRQIN